MCMVDVPRNDCDGIFYLLLIIGFYTKEIKKSMKLMLDYKKLSLYLGTVKMENDTINLAEYTEQAEQENQDAINSSQEEESEESPDEASSGFDAIDVAFISIIGTFCVIVAAYFFHKFFGRFKMKINAGKTGIEFEDSPDDNTK